MRLCKQLGKTLKELLSSIDSQELSLWMAYDRLDPLDDPYWRTGLTCSTMATLHTGKKFKAEDFIPRRENKKNDIKTFLDNIVKKQGEKSQLLD
tara:strand:+ start:7754 stop:8035 length:282 start_codon:yes stop_codon:yes gene_type:complete